MVDTNVLYTDVRANGLLLRSMLDDASPTPSATRPRGLRVRASSDSARSRSSMK
jgi:hypothetical protein